MIRALTALAFAMGGLALPATAVECRNQAYLGSGYSICTVDLESEALRLFLNAPDGGAWSTFTRLDTALRAEGKALMFAMNGGMYHSDLRPVGHYIEDGLEAMRVVPNAGPGNFGLLPNGVLCIAAGTARVIETLAYLEARPECLYATQSGPMLVIDGALHPRFVLGSPSRNIRNGVGTSEDGRTAHFVISNDPVSFHDFATLFRDELGVPDALFLDGTVSRLYAPQLGRHDGGFAMGPIVGVVAERR